MQYVHYLYLYFVFGCFPVQQQCSSPPCSGSHVSVYCQLGSGPCVVQWLLCIHTYVHTVHRCLCCVHVVRSMGLCTFSGYTYSTLCSIKYIYTYSICMYIMHSTCALCNSRCTLCNSTHALCNSGQIFLQKASYVGTWYVRPYRMAGNFGRKIFWRNAENMSFGGIYFGS